MEWETKDRFFRRLVEAADGPATESGSEPGHDSPTKSLISLIRERLDQHPHFRGRNLQLQIDLIDGSVVLSGRLPSHYLKQLLQEAIKVIPDVANIHNRVVVMSPTS